MKPAFKYSVSVNTMDTGLSPGESKVCILALGLILLVSTSGYFIFEPNTLKWLAHEDGLVENLSAIHWLVAAVIMFFLFAKQRNVWFLLLGLLFIVCLGEEISWGQRLIGFSTPESIRANNFQGEFNLHNLNFFERRYGNKGFWAVMRDVGRMFAIFWFTYGIVLPILLKLSGRLRRFVKHIRLPLMPLTIGVFFLINYAQFQYFEDIHQLFCARVGIVNNANCSSLPVEMREWFDSLLFLVFTLLLLLAHNRAASVSLALDKQHADVLKSRQPERELLHSCPGDTVSRR